MGYYGDSGVGFNKRWDTMVIVGVGFDRRWDTMVIVG